VIGAVLGVPMATHGVNNIYEGGSNMWDTYNGVKNPDNVGILRSGYQKTSEFLTGDKEYGNIAYSTVDVATSIASLGRKVGEKVISSGAVTSYEKVSSFAQTYATKLGKTTLGVEVGNYWLNIENTVKNWNKSE